jgi:mRNA interferase MazF
MVIRQGDVYWLSLFGIGSEPAGRRPAVVVQADHFNRSAINTAVVAAITSNLRLGDMPGNVRLRKGEAGLPQASVVNVSQLRTVDRSRLAERIGSVGDDRIAQVLHGLALVFGVEVHDANAPERR